MASNPLTGGLGQLSSADAQGGSDAPAPSTPPAVSGGPNALATPGSSPGTSPANRTQGGRGNPMDELLAQHDYARSVYDTVTKARVMLDHMRREMDNLTKMGDTVQPTDVMQAAGRVVGHGVNAKEMASILADMPTQGGQGLAAWVSMHDAAIQQQEMHVEMVGQVARHRLGQATMQALSGMHMIQRARENAGVAAGGMGALAPRAGGAATSRPVTAPPGQSPPASPASNALSVGGETASNGGEESS